MDTPYAAAWTATYRLIAEGWSWSGRERNCCFLNTGDGRFADVSAVSGLDLPDDGRAVAIVDWDQDGRLDFWVSNRSAPALRFLHNTTTMPHRFVALRLVGTRCNRDAIGARVELHLSRGEPRRVVRALRAGEGFLAQSSKWLHFGLGKDGVPERIVVRWPGGSREEFRLQAANRRYEIVQGTGKTVEWKGPRSPGEVRFPDVEPTEPKPDSQVRAVVFRQRRPSLEKLAYRSLDGAAKTLDAPHAGPMLIILWASWCPPCLAELKEVAEREQELRKENVTVLALNVDGLDPENGVGVSQIRQVLKDRGFAFEVGAATPETIQLLEQTQYEIIQKLKQLPVPSSFLVDGDNGVVAMYKGRVEVPQFLADAKLVSAEPRVLRDAAVPFSGRWLHDADSKRRDGLPIARIIEAFLTDPRVLAGFACLFAVLIARYFRRRGKRELKRDDPRNQISVN
jgi:thiol-disulfide isomerase/thioredoxin